MSQKRLALIGYGAMSQSVFAGLSREPDRITVGAVLVRSPLSAPPSGVAMFTSVDELMSWKPDLAAECAGHAAVSDVVPVLLAGGIDVVIASIGAMASTDLRARINAAAESGSSKCHLVSGAIGGLDALAAARLAGLDEVVYEGRKPPMAWQGTPAQDAHDLTTIREPRVLFEGSAGEACRLYPKNANVTAAVALAGVGFDETIVRLVADPHISRNQHRVKADGRFGKMEMTLANEPLPDNPKTSWLASLSVEQVIRRELMARL